MKPTITRQVSLLQECNTLRGKSEEYGAAVLCSDGRAATGGGVNYAATGTKEGIRNAEATKAFACENTFACTF